MFLKQTGRRRYSWKARFSGIIQNVVTSVAYMLSHFCQSLMRADYDTRIYIHF